MEEELLVVSFGSPHRGSTRKDRGLTSEVDDPKTRTGLVPPAASFTRRRGGEAVHPGSFRTSVDRPWADRRPSKSRGPGTTRVENSTTDSDSNPPKSACRPGLRTECGSWRGRTRIPLVTWRPGEKKRHFTLRSQMELLNPPSVLS